VALELQLDETIPDFQHERNLVDPESSNRKAVQLASGYTSSLLLAD